MPEDKVVEVEKAVHPLLTREIRPIYNWCEWLACWESGQGYQWFESLLHVGFQVSLESGKYGEKEYDRIDRIIFYLKVADGWASYSSSSFWHSTDPRDSVSLGWDSEGHRVTKTMAELRQLLARKAFDVLCLNFFKMEKLGRGRDGEFFNEGWENVVSSERLFPVIMNFFRVEEEFSRFRMCNLVLNSLNEERRSHNEKQAVAFLLNLAEFIWERPSDLLPPYWLKGEEKEKFEKQLAATAVRVEAAKPWMVEVLYALGRLDVLDKRILLLEEACLAKLKEIALRTKLDHRQHVGQSMEEGRFAKTIDEALLVGSEAALFLKKHEVMFKENKRLENIYKAEQARDEAERKLKELTSKK